MTTLNKLHRLVSKVNTSPLPLPAKQAALSLLFNSQVKLAFTAGIQIQELTNAHAQLQLKNRMRVQNHIGGVHACGMALLAESATGIVFGMNVPDTSIPVIKSMSIQYKKRAKGDLQAVASLTPEQIEDILSKEKGEVLVDVKVTDSTGESPIECEMLWAWVSKQRNPVGFPSVIWTASVLLPSISRLSPRDSLRTMPINRELPAGVATRRESTDARVVKRPSGQNVARFIAREEELHQARAYTSVNETTASRARWEEKQNLRTGSGARTQQQKQCNMLTLTCALFDGRLEEEMELMNKEVQVVRHERLKKYYETCYEEWDQELRARGLAIVRDRD